MPNEYPYFPFYVDAFLSDGKVMQMSALEVGSYLLLLCQAWKEEPRGSIPADDAVLARWARLSPAEWSECSPRVLACFTLRSDNRWHQKRMELEAEKLQALAITRSKAGKKGASARWQSDGKANDNRMREPMAKGWQTISNSSSQEEISSQEEKENRDEDGGLGEGEGQRMPLPSAGLDIFLSQEWQMHSRCTAPSQRLADEVRPFFAEILRLGADPQAVLDRIKDRQRDRTEPTWEFKKFFFPKANGAKAPKESMSEAMQRMRREQAEKGKT